MELRLLSEEEFISVTDCFPVTELILRHPNRRAKVDTRLLPRILAASTKWFSYFHPGVQTHYVATDRNRKRTFLHRVVTSAPDGMEVDHIHHDGLDNRLSELRVVTHAENMRNQRPKANKHGQEGVRAIGNRFQARARSGGKWIFIGSFLTADEAGAAYRKFRQDRLKGVR